MTTELEILPDEAFGGSREAPIKSHVRECTEQLDKLVALTAQLEDRLAVIRLPRRRDDPRANEEKMIAQASPLATAIRANVLTVKETTLRLARLLGELEL